MFAYQGGEEEIFLRLVHCLKLVSIVSLFHHIQRFYCWKTYAIRIFHWPIVVAFECCTIQLVLQFECSTIQKFHNTRIFRIPNVLVTRMFPCSNVQTVRLFPIFKRFVVRLNLNVSTIQMLRSPRVSNILLSMFS